MFRFPSYMNEYLNEVRFIPIKKNDPDLLAAASEGVVTAGANPPHPSELVGVEVYVVVGGVPRKIGVVLVATSDSVVVGVNRR